MTYFYTQNSIFLLVVNSSGSTEIKTKSILNLLWLTKAIALFWKSLSLTNSASYFLPFRGFSWLLSHCWCSSKVHQYPRATEQSVHCLHWFHIQKYLCLLMMISHALVSVHINTSSSLNFFHNLDCPQYFIAAAITLSVFMKANTGLLLA